MFFKFGALNYKDQLVICISVKLFSEHFELKLVELLLQSLPMES